MPSYRELSEARKKEWAELRAQREERRQQAKRAAARAANTIVLPQNDYTRALRLSEEPWSKASGLPRPPAHAVSKRDIFRTLVANGARMGATAKSLGISPQSLRRRLKFDTDLAAVWAEVAIEFQKPVRTKGPAGPRFLRLCSEEERRIYQGKLRTLLR
jgi:hypothetical protein